MIAVKLRIPYIPRFETVKVPPPSSGGVIVPSRTRATSALCLAGDLAERLLVGVEDGRHDQRVVGGDGDPHVDPRVQLHLAVAVAPVGPRVLPQCQRRRLDDHVVVGRDLASPPCRAAGASRFSSARSATHASMSTSICSEKSGIVAFDSAIRRAIVAWVRVSSTTSSPPWPWPPPRAPRPGRPARRSTLAGVGSAWPSGWRGSLGRRDRTPGALAAPTTSAFTILPPGPEPDRVLEVDPAAPARACAPAARP